MTITAGATMTATGTAVINARTATRDRGAQYALLLRHVSRRQKCQPGDRATEDHRADRPVGLRQEHRAALLQPHERPRAGHAARGRGAVSRQEPVRPRCRCGRGAPPDRHGLPEAQPVPQVDLREHRLRPANQRLARLEAGYGRAGRALAARRGAVGRGQGQAQAVRHWRSRAGSSSACASPARWRSSRR